MLQVLASKGSGASASAACLLLPLCPPPAYHRTPAPPPPPLLTALLNSATIAIFQGSPLGRPFGQFIERARVTALGLVPSIVKVSWRRAQMHHHLLAIEWVTCRRRCSPFLISH